MVAVVTNHIPVHPEGKQIAHLTTVVADGALTDEELVAAPGVGKFILLRGILVTDSSAVTHLTLEHGTTAIYTLRVTSNEGPVGWHGWEHRLPTNTALTVTTTAASDLQAAFEYQVK